MKKKEFIITGATSGIGLHLARELDKVNNKLYLIGRNETVLNELKSSFKAEVVALAVDLCKSKCSELLSNYTFERIVGFIHCAGLQSNKPLHLLKREDFFIQFQLGILPLIEILQLILKAKRADTSYVTSVVTLSSIAATDGGATQTAYSAGKGAINAVIKPLSKELHKFKIRLNALSPGLVDTEMTRNWFRRCPIMNNEKLDSLQYWGLIDKQAISESIKFLLDDKTKHIAGSNLEIDAGGLKSVL